jgi:putative aldouronate transport system permease protein
MSAPIVPLGSNRIRLPKSSVAFKGLSVGFLLVLSLFCLLPFLLIFTGSVTDEQEIARVGFSLWPGKLSLASYDLLFRHPESIVRSYGVSILITAAGTSFGLLFTAMAAYVMGKQDFKYRNKLSFFFYFTTLFSGGMVSSYIFIIRYLHLKDSLLALILPMLINSFYLLIMRSFFTAVPVSVLESAKIDGASEYRIFFQIALPLVKSGLATIGLFIALDYWNDWYNAMLYLTTNSKYPLQYLLYNMLSTTEVMSRLSSLSHIQIQNMPSESLKMAMAVVATGPILLAYPFVQKYFVKGITVGAVKG